MRDKAKEKMKREMCCGVSGDWLEIGDIIKNSSQEPVSLGDTSESKSVSPGSLATSSAKWKQAEQTEIALLGLMCLPHANLITHSRKKKNLHQIKH